MNVRLAIYKGVFPHGVIPVVEMTLPCSEDDIINAVLANYEEFEIRNARNGEKEIILPGESVIWISSSL